MARARCTECRAHVWWTASRGARLADQRCPSCGGRLVGGRAAGELPDYGARRTCIVCRVDRELADPILVELDPYKGVCRTHPVAAAEAAITRVWAPFSGLVLVPERHRPNPLEVLRRYRAALPEAGL